jgi:hypothetical protein
MELHQNHPLTRRAGDLSSAGTASPDATAASSLVWTPFLLLCLIAAAAAIRRIAALLLPGSSGNPDMAALDASFASRTALTIAHIVPALLLVILLPLWFSHRIRSRMGLHRRITWALFLLGFVVGGTAIVLSFHPVGGINEASASLLYDGLFLFSLGRALVLFLRGDWALHRTWMVRGIAVLLGIATTRPIMGVFFATSHITHLEPAQFFGTAFWLGFTVTYIAGEAYLRFRPAVPAA